MRRGKLIGKRMENYCVIDLDEGTLSPPAPGRLQNQILTLQWPNSATRVVSRFLHRPRRFPSDRTNARVTDTPRRGGPPRLDPPHCPGSPCPACRAAPACVFPHMQEGERERARESLTELIQLKSLRWVRDQCSVRRDCGVESVVTSAYLIVTGLGDSGFCIFWESEEEKRKKEDFHLCDKFL